jgi:hypothetical protein
MAHCRNGFPKISESNRDPQDAPRPEGRGRPRAATHPLIFHVDGLQQIDVGYQDHR